MNWLKTTILVLQLIFEFGPRLYQIAKEVYENVEEWSANKKLQGIQVSSAEKAMRFDEAIKNFASPDADIPKLREGVHKILGKKP